MSNSDSCLTAQPVARAEMLIRKPVAEVFAAFADPEITSQFWFSRGSGKLHPGATVTWHWETYGFSTPATVTAFEPEHLIAVNWGEPGEATQIAWRFTARDDGATFVSVENSGFAGSADERVAGAIGSTEGFTFVLAGAKAWLEHGVRLSLVSDRFPDGLASA